MIWRALKTGDPEGMSVPELVDVVYHASREPACPHAVIRCQIQRMRRRGLPIVNSVVGLGRAGLYRIEHRPEVRS